MKNVLIKRKPRLLQVDNGKQFYNIKFDKLMKKYDIKKYSTFSTTKACIVERFNRTLKSLMFKEFTARGTHKWISILPDLLNTKHRAIEMTPSQADETPAVVQLNIRKINNKKNKFKVGDKVRISKNKSIFDKGYLPNWSSEIFTIAKINKTLPRTFYLQDYRGNNISGCFYTEELNKTQHPDDYLIEKIIRKDNKVFVKWLGFDITHNSWINSSDFKK